MKMIQVNGSKTTGSADIHSILNHLQGLADTLSSTIRQNVPLNNSVQLQGTVVTNSTCVLVNWKWFALPCSLLLFTFFFVGMSTIHFQRRTDKARGPWKTSILPALWSGIEEKIQNTKPWVSTVNQMEQIGQSLQVHFESKEYALTTAVPTDEQFTSRRPGWRFRELDHHDPQEEWHGELISTNTSTHEISLNDVTMLPHHERTIERSTLLYFDFAHYCRHVSIYAGKSATYIKQYTQSHFDTDERVSIILHHQHIYCHSSICHVILLFS